MKHWGLLGRAIFLGTLPTLFLSWVLGTFFLTTRFQELNQNSTYQGHILVTSYASALSGAPEKNTLTLQNKSKLQEIGGVIIEDHNIRSVTIYGSDELAIAQSGPIMQALAKVEKHLPTAVHRGVNDSVQKSFSRETADSTRIIAPIYQNFNVTQKGDEASPIGWIEVEIDASNTIIAKYQTTLLILIVVFIALIINIYGSLRYSREISSTLQNIMRSIGSMISGKLDTNIKEDSYGELKELQEGVNALSLSILLGHKELQQNVDQASEDLQETLETIEIQNIELDLARKEALEASRIKSEFLANMSHEIRTPLNGVIGFTNLLLKSQINYSQRDYLETIQKSSESLLALINDVLDFSKIEAGKLALDHTPLNLSEIVSDVLTMLAPMAYDKKIEQVSLFYSDVPQHVMGDPLRLKQILTNLVNNAIKFTAEGAITVRVMLDETKDNIAIIKITVSDTGIGLSKEQQQQLFSAFRQADTSTARRFGGTGLGLVISKHLVEQMRGQIGVESTPGQGSTFWFTFKAEMHNDHNEQHISIDHKNHQIAIFDENSTVKNALQNTLQRQNYSLTDCQSFTDIHSIVSNQKLENLPAAILIGISPQTPKHKEIANVIQSNANNIPLILLGNHIDQMIIGGLLKSVPPPLIPKPLAQKKTLHIINEVLTAKIWQQVGREQSSEIHNDTLEIETKTEPQQPNNMPTDPTNKVPSLLSILVVDDNAANLKLLTVLLTDLAIDVTPCDNGNAAVTLAKENSYDLILMDIQMPGMDGIEATLHIRGNEAGKRKTPIIAVTAHALANEKQALLKSGMDDYVTKPIDENQLRHIIQQWTGKSLSSQENPIISQPPTSNEIVDLALNLKLANNKQDLADDMLSMLFKSLTEDKITLQNHIDSQDYSSLLDNVHKLHGATKYTGVPKLQRSAQALEENLKEELYYETNALYQTLISDIDDIIQWSVQHERFEV